jgi:hypothetical protein
MSSAGKQEKERIGAIGFPLENRERAEAEEPQRVRRERVKMRMS